MILLDFDGVTEVPVYARDLGGMLDCYVRCPSREVWHQVGQAVSLLYVDEEGNIRPGRGVDFTELGPIIHTDPETGTSTVIDPRWHVNLRLTGYALERPVEGYDRPLWEVTMLSWMLAGQDDAQINNAERGKIYSAVVLLDPESFTPQRVWQ